MKLDKISAAMPMVYTVVGYSLNISLLVYRCFKLGNPIDIILFLIMCIIYLAWSVWEIRISLRELKLEASTNDKSTLEIAGIIKNIMIFAGLLSLDNINLIIWTIGIVLIIGGIYIRVSAIKLVGESYSHRIREIVGTPIMTGPYKIIRHPSYLGTLIIHTGLVLILFNYISLIALILWYANAVYRVISEEVVLLRNIYYKDYIKKTKYRLFPLIW
ncbi:MAG: isoprenylcysteine carboxylmethyltransferase family protein [Clostridiales bacterium]|nr:isoprenylcysteine carboxylmethyltransferase family protein [Bacillota bacterium]NLK04424.1 isoprenylcysteine carboxylmethyltransferase family protein [Clostridiales bacterium]